MSLADEYVARLEPWMTPDLETYLRAISAMFEEVELLAFETDTVEAWQVLLDPDLIPAKGLPYLAQYLGEKLPEGIPVALAREWLKDNPNRYRGTPYSIFRAAQRNLTGNRQVGIRERDNGTGPDTDVEILQVMTLVAQTPDPALTETDIRSVLPADVILNYQVLPGQTWNDLSAFGTWNDVAAFGSWAAVAAATPGWPNTFTRPRPT